MIIPKFTVSLIWIELINPYKLHSNGFLFCTKLMLHFLKIKVEVKGQEVFIKRNKVYTYAKNVSKQIKTGLETKI